MTKPKVDKATLQAALDGKDAPAEKRGRGRPRKDGQPVKSAPKGEPTDADWKMLQLTATNLTLMVGDMVYARNNAFPNDQAWKEIRVAATVSMLQKHGKGLAKWSTELNFAMAWGLSFSAMRGPKQTLSAVHLLNGGRRSSAPSAAPSEAQEMVHDSE